MHTACTTYSYSQAEMCFPHKKLKKFGRFKIHSYSLRRCVVLGKSHHKHLNLANRNSSNLRQLLIKVFSKDHFGIFCSLIFVVSRRRNLAKACKMYLFWAKTTM